MNHYDTLVADKIWASDEVMPSGDQAHNQKAPPNWFHEHVEYAAELYGLERGLPENVSDKEYTIFVIDNEGGSHTFAVRVRRQLVAYATKSHRSTDGGCRTG